MPTIKQRTLGLLKVLEDLIREQPDDTERIEVDIEFLNGRVKVEARAK